MVTDFPTMRDDANFSCRPARRRLGRLLGCAILLAALPWLAACNQEQHPNSVATVNDKAIGLEQFRAQTAFMGLGNNPKALTPDLRRAVLETMLRRRLALDQAQARGIKLEPEELDREEASLRRGLSEEAFERTLAAQGIDYDDWRRVLAQELLVQKAMDLLLAAQVQISAEEVRTFYQEHRNEFRRPEQVLAQHALMPSKELAQQLLDRVLKGEDMAQAAAELEVPLADEGEPIWLARGHMPEALENKVFSLEPGKVAGPLPSAYGFHVVRVLAKRPASELDLAQAAEEIQRRLSAEKKEVMATSLVDELRAKAKVWFDSRFERTGELGK